MGGPTSGEVGKTLLRRTGGHLGVCLRGQRKSGCRERSEYTRRITVWPVMSVGYQAGEEEGRGCRGCEAVQ